MGSVFGRARRRQPIIFCALTHLPEAEYNSKHSYAKCLSARSPSFASLGIVIFPTGVAPSAREQIKTLPGGMPGRVHAEKMTDGKGVLGGPSRVCAFSVSVNEQIADTADKNHRWHRP